MIPVSPKKAQNSLLWLALACEKQRAPPVDLVEAPISAATTVHRSTGDISFGVKKQRRRRKRKLTGCSNVDLLEKTGLQVRHFAISSMTGEEREKQKARLAIQFGAKSAKQPYVNYKELKVQRQLQEAKRLEALKQIANLRIKGNKKKKKQKRKTKHR
uniref:Uncharacterized protein n=1 Tax=Trichuris muris TaxID=70415 RepID=A0A5S6QVT9_TRIMR